jgi:hypothetical protein
MERYHYLLFSSGLLLAVLIVYLLRKDLAPVILNTGVFGAVWGPVAEYWYFKDYWRPQSVFGKPILEDALFGFSIAALGACSYKLWCLRRVAAGKLYRAHYSLPAVFMAVYVPAMFLFNTTMGVNSIWVSALVYVSLSGWIARQRPDLIVPALMSGVIVGAYSLVLYGIGLNFLVDGQKELSRIWLLNASRYGTTLLGIPLTEVAWFFSWGCLSGISYEYATGRGFQHLRKDRVAVPLSLSSTAERTSAAASLTSDDESEHNQTLRRPLQDNPGYVMRAQGESLRR